MNQPAAKLFNLPYQQYDRYWISVFARAGTFPPAAAEALQALGYRKTAEGVRVLQTPMNWALAWKSTYAILQKAQLTQEVEIAISASETAEIEADQRKSVAAVQAIAENLWLGEALLEGRVMCYFQPVVGDKNKVFGYESFVRSRSAEGEIVSGNRVVQASKALNIEYMIDRYLHVQAIKTFAESHCAGFLFVNFFPGFIHRPAVYLKELSEAAKLFGIVPKHVVLEFTRAEQAHDLKHLKNVCEYGRSQGYSIALDDMVTLDHAKKLVGEIRPDFVKLDCQSLGALDAPTVRASIQQMVELVHATGSSVIAEGVETEAMYEQLRTLGVDLFQGYYFSPPAPIEELK